MRKGFVWILTLVVVVLVGCKGAEPLRPPTSPIATPTSLASPPRPIPGPVAEGVVIDYWRQGGIAGLDERWQIHADGTIVTIRDGQHTVTTVPAEEVARLLEEFEAAGFFDFRDSYLPTDTCCDRFIYVITVFRAGESKTVTTIDSAPEEPAALSELIDALNQLVAGS